MLIVWDWPYSLTGKSRRHWPAIPLPGLKLFAQFNSMELAINQACRLSKAGSNDFDRPKKKLLQLEGRSSGKRMSLSCLKKQCFRSAISLCSEVCGQECRWRMRREETQDPRRCTLPPPGEVENFDLVKKFFIYLGRLCLRSLFHKFS